ncbi:MAG TPA: polysaccharide biosynthesis/export family protein [Gemmatimonadaceae bacterium]
MRRKSSLITWIVCLVLAVGAREADAQSGSTEATLKPGDVVRISVWDTPTLSGEFTVGPDGALKHPIYKKVNVTGVPIPQLTGEIETFLKTIQNEPKVEVEPLVRVMLGGEIRAPNVYTLAPETTIAEAIARAGGPTDMGLMDQVTVVRGDRREVIDASATGARGGGMLIRSGDQILLGRKHNVLRDYIGPVASIAASIAAFINLARR